MILGKLEEYHIPIRTHLVFLVMSVIIVFISLFLPVTVHSHEELREVRLGLPIHFVVQDQSRYDPPFPYPMRFYSNLEVPTRVNFIRLVLSIFLVFTVLDSGLIILVSIKNRPGNKS